MKMILALAAVLALGGCATNFEKFYVNMNDGKQVSQLPMAIPGQGTPSMYIGKYPAEDRDAMIRKGYGQLGYSAFSDVETNVKDAQDMGGKINASVVYVYSRVGPIETGPIPYTKRSITTSTVSGPNLSQYTIKTPTETTTQVPYAVQRFDYYASYWVKLKPPILGVYSAELPIDIKSRAGTNSGVLAEYVRKDSVAYEEDIIDGDAILSIDGIPLSSPDDLSAAIQDRQGKQVSIVVFRNGQRIEKQLTLNTAQ